MLEENRKGKQQKRRFKFVTCECGFKILMVPDAKAMAKAVEDHIAMHCKQIKDPTKAPSEIERLWDLLSEQIFENASQLKQLMKG
jgi:hypothetical protein